jgi:ferrous iron transport protein B
VPKPGNILNKTLARLEWYLKEAVPLFMLGTLLLFGLARTGLLRLVERAAAPVVVNLLSLPQEAASAFVVGFLRRDYGAVYLADAARQGELSGLQIVVALVTLTLFVPCVANYFIMIKERGLKTATLMGAFIFPFAFLVGGILNWTLRRLGVFL